jgi:hypothetical protein
MKSIILAAALVALAPVAFAQSSGGMNNYPNGSMASSSGPTTGQGENCGTPDQFKPCPPLPRHPLAYYPANKRS